MKRSFTDREMHRYVAFLRAINVAGHGTLKMEDLRSAFERAGCRAVRTYIQSGNVVFESPERDTTALLVRVRRTLRNRLGEEPGVLLRRFAELSRMVGKAPFGALETVTAVKLCVSFLFETPRVRPPLPLVSSREALELVALTRLEAFVVSRRKANGFYGFPNNFVEQALGVAATTRNVSTLRKIVESARVEPAR